MSCRIVKGTGHRKGTYLVKDNNYIRFQAVTLAEANKYVNLHKKREQLKKELSKVDNQIYNIKINYDKIANIYQKNKSRLSK